jgi:HlyD family secretion protein
VRPDLSATARIVTARRSGVLSVPIIALTVREPKDTLPAGADSAKADSTARTARDTTAGRRRDIEGVFVVDTTTMDVRFRPVKVGIAGDEHFEVLTGLDSGVTIVAGPYQAIRDLRNDARVKRASETGGRGETKAP